jgi:hypothetical protein
MALSFDILASTLRILRDREVDNTFRTVPLLDAVQKAGNVEKVNGGSKVDHPVILTEHSSITQLATGYESVNLAVKDPLRTASFDWCDFVAPVVVTEKEQLSNKGDRAVIRIAEARLKSVMGMLKREWEKQTVAGTSTILTELNTLNGMGTAAVGAFPLTPIELTGFFNHEAFGSQNTNTVGGIRKADFTGSWQNQVSDVGGTFGASAGLLAMSRLMIESSTYTPEGDIDIILASPKSYEQYRNSLAQLERYSSMEQMKSTAGRLGILYNGAMMYIEPNLGFRWNGGGANDDVSMYFLNSKLFSVYFDRDAFFEMGKMERISGYAAMSSNIMTRSQLCISNLSGHGVLIGAEA